MKYILTILIFIISLNAKELPSFEIIQPLTKSVFKEEFASVVIKLNKKTKATKIIINNNNKKYVIDVKGKKLIYCKTINLMPANNTLKISTYINNNKLNEKVLNLFYQSEVIEGAVDIPKDFNTNFFHAKKNEKLCKQCHNMNSDKKTIKSQNNEFFKKGQKSYNLILNDVTQSNCFDCHKSLISRKNSHAPSINLACSACHTGESSEFNKEFKGKSKYLAPDPIAPKCFSCHEGRDKEWYNKESKHGPVMTGRCTKCHNPHSSNDLFFLRKPIWNLCTTCHDEKAKGKHVLASFVFGRNKGAHPTKGRPDPARPGRELVCSGCHNPHGSDGIYLLRMKSKSTYGVCKRCHQK